MGTAVEVFLLKSSLCLAPCLSGPSLPWRFTLSLGGALGNQGGFSPCVGDSSHCPLFLQLKSKWDESIFTKGCIQALEGWLPRNIYIVAGVFIAISLLQVCSHCPLWLPLPLWLYLFP